MLCSIQITMENKIVGICKLKKNIRWVGLCTWFGIFGRIELEGKLNLIG